MSTSAYGTVQNLASQTSTADNLLLQSASCPVCSEDHVHYAFSMGLTRVLQCPDCGFTFRTTVSNTYQKPLAATKKLIEKTGGVKALLRQIIPSASNPHQLQVVDWDGPAPKFLDFTEEETTPSTANNEEAGIANVVLSVGQLDSLNDPLPALRALRSELVGKNNKIIFVYSDIRFSGAQVGSRNWEQQIGEHNAYLDTHTALTLLYRAGFRSLGINRLRKRTSLEALISADGQYLSANTWLRFLAKWIPAGLRKRINITTRSADIAIIAQPSINKEPLVSVVIPVFNEAATVAVVLDTVLRVSFKGAKIELVVVESNSTDGSREIVQRYASNPRVHCIFEDRPRGKGHATRLGLAQAGGDILIIQDADLEYDIEDYHALIDPIIRGHESFVLGSRHGGRNHWKLRQFSKPLLAYFYNMAHVLVTGYINLLFRLKLRDPQTMFKVCRRDCVEGLTFHGNYFNFDYELLLKVVRKGYQPIEVPVNYRSRSHAEGKKIRMWRDAPLGLWMITRLWLTPLRRFLTIGERIE